MGNRTSRAGLVDWARRERAGWELLLAEVGEARMDEPGPMGRWTFKDLIVHLTAWQQFEQAPLVQAGGGDHPAPPWPAGLDPHRDQDEINQFVYEGGRDRPPLEVVREGRRMWDQLEEGLSKLPEAALIDPHHFDWMGGKALGPAVVRDATAHYHQDHEADVRAWLAGHRSTG